MFRDVKPENIMLREDGRVKLLDFGSVGALEEHKKIITGTKGYSAPEQWEERGKIGFYSDVYAFGKVLFYMLNGQNAQGNMQWTAGLKLRRGIRRLTEDCVRENVEERVPNMRVVLHRLTPYVTERKGRIFWQEVKTILFQRKQSYIYQQNILHI